MLFLHGSPHLSQTLSKKERGLEQNVVSKSRSSLAHFATRPIGEKKETYSIETTKRFPTDECKDSCRFAFAPIAKKQRELCRTTQGMNKL